MYIHQISLWVFDSFFIKYLNYLNSYGYFSGIQLWLQASVLQVVHMKDLGRSSTQPLF